jgi:hypothetical protein
VLALREGREEDRQAVSHRGPPAVYNLGSRSTSQGLAEHEQEQPRRLSPIHTSTMGSDEVCFRFSSQSLVSTPKPFTLNSKP